MSLPFYQPVGHEVEVFEHCHHQQLPLMLKGPTGCGKSRFVEHMAARLERPLVSVPLERLVGWRSVGLPCPQ